MLATTSSRVVVASKIPGPGASKANLPLGREPGGTLCIQIGVYVG